MILVHFVKPNRFFSRLNKKKKNLIDSNRKELNVPYVVCTDRTGPDRTEPTRTEKKLTPVPISTLRSRLRECKRKENLATAQGPTILPAFVADSLVKQINFSRFMKVY